MKYILALDQGTTSSRAIIFDHNGAIVACAQREFTQIFPQPGWVEHDPLEIWQVQLAVVHEVISLARITHADIAAIGITNQRETTVVWERGSGQPIYNAIVWQDRRTASMCDLLKHDGFEPLFSGKTGLVLDPYFSGTKIRWILDHVPSARDKAMRGELAFGTIDSWLIWNLTGGAHVSDASNASRTLLYNIHTNTWDDKLLGMLGIPRSMLPEVCASSEVIATTKESIFGKPIPIAGVAGDQQAALFGQRCTTPGMVKNTYGTGCFMLMHTGEHAVHSKNKLLTTVAWKINNQVEYALEGSVFVAGATIQWLRDGLQIIENAAESETLANGIVDSGGVYFVPAFSGLGAPYWDANARGTMVGITRGTTAAHLARAGLEAIAYQNAEVLDAMRADSNIELSELRVDGGATQNKFLMQFQADVLQVPVILAETQEATALGAAYLAGLGVGYWQNIQEIDALWKAKQRFEPRMEPENVRTLRYKWAKAVECARTWGSDQ